MAVGDMNSGTALTDSTLSEAGLPADAAATGEVLAKKLDLTGGTMTGAVILTHEGTFYPITSDNNGDTDNFILISNTAKGRKLGFGIGLGRWQGIFDFVSGKYLINSDTETNEVFVDGQLFKGAVVASGSNYVRFGDGTQICWGVVQLNGSISDSNLRVTFPLPFIDTPRIFPANNANVGVAINVGIGWESSTSFSIGTAGIASNGWTSWLAIGRWK